MPNPFPNLPADERGTLRRWTFDSTCLKENAWGDPSERDLWVYEPAGADHLGPLPCIIVLPAFASTGEAQFSRSLTDISLATRFDQ